MARAQQKFQLLVADSSGSPWTGQTVELKRGASTVLLTEVGSGWYKTDAIDVGQWSVYVNSTDQGRTVPIGAGEVDVPDYANNPDSNYTTDSSGVPQLSGPNSVVTSLTIGGASGVTGAIDTDSTYLRNSGTPTTGNIPKWNADTQQLEDSGKSADNLITTSSFVEGQIPQFDANGNLVDSGKTVSDFTETQSFTDGNLAEFDSVGDLVDTGKTKENIAFKNEENIFTEINSFENSIVTGIADSYSVYTGTANAEIAVSLFKCPVSHCLFAGARSANQTHVTWYKKELGGAWAEYRTEVTGFGTGTRYAYVAMPLRSGRVLIGTGFVNTYLYISDDGGETVTKGYTLDGTYTSILSGIQLRNGHIVLGLGSQNGDGNLVYCTEQENAENATVWKNIEMNASYDRIFALEEARTDELVVGTGSDLNGAYLVVFPDQNDLSTFNEYQIGPSDSLVRVTFLDCSDEAWLINCRDSSNGYKSYFTTDKGITISAFPDITIGATTYNLVQLKYSSTGRLYASLRDGSGNCFISHCDNATAENIASNSLQWSPVEAVAVGTGASVTDMMEVDGKMYLAAGANGSVWLSERDYNNTLNREDGQFGAKVLSASKEIVEEGVTLEQKYAQLNKSNKFSQEQKFKEDVTLDRDIYSPCDLDFQKWGEIGAQFERVWAIAEITDGDYNGRILVGTGNDLGDGKVFYSDDRGKTWTESTGTPASERCRSLLYVSGSTVLAGFKIGVNALYQSTDGGATFTVNANHTMRSGSDEVCSLVKNDAGRIFAGGGSLSAAVDTSDFQYTDNLSTFNSATLNGSGAKAIEALLVAKNGDIFIGAYSLSSNETVLKKSIDAGVTFNDVSSTNSGEEQTFALTQNRKTGVLYSLHGGSVGVIQKSADGGNNWAPINSAIYSGFNVGYSAESSEDGRVFLGMGSGANDGVVLVSDDDFASFDTIVLDSGFEAVRTLFITSRYDLLAGTGSDAGDGDLWGAPIYNYAVIDGKSFIKNYRDYGAIHQYPVDAVCGDICFDLLDNEPHYYNGTEWLPTHLGEQTFLYLDWDGTASINHGDQNVWQVVKFWDANDFNQVTYNGNTGVDGGSYNFDLIHYGFWFRALLNLSISASTGSHTVEFAIEMKLDSEQWPEEGVGAIGDNIVAGSIKPATIDSAGGSITQVTRARITEKMQIRVITRCTSGANKITNFSYGIKEITRVS